VNNLPKFKNKSSGGVECFWINTFIPPKKLPKKELLSKKNNLSSITPPVKI